MVANPDEHLPKAMRSLSTFATCWGGRPAGYYAGGSEKGLEEREELDGTLFAVHRRRSSVVVVHHRPSSLVVVGGPSSLMIYPRPYPSAATGPKPNKRSAGLPQFEVERIDMPRVDQPPSRKTSGSAGEFDELMFTPALVSSSRRRRQ